MNILIIIGWFKSLESVCVSSKQKKSKKKQHRVRSLQPWSFNSLLSQFLSSYCYSPITIVVKKITLAINDRRPVNLIVDVINTESWLTSTYSIIISYVSTWWVRSNFNLKYCIYKLQLWLLNTEHTTLLSQWINNHKPTVHHCCCYSSKWTETPFYIVDTTL